MSSEKFLFALFCREMLAFVLRKLAAMTVMYPPIGVILGAK